MYKYDGDKIYKNKEGKRVKVSNIVNVNGFVGYDIELIDESNRQLYNITEEELDDLLQ